MRSLKTFLKLFLRPRGMKRFPASSRILRPYRIAGGRSISVGERSFIGHLCNMEALQAWEGKRLSPSIEIGNDVYIGGYAHIYAMDSIRIGDFCVLSEQVYITDNSHGFNPDAGPIMKQPLESKGPVDIGAFTFIGFGARIMPGVTLGRHCVVGTNAVVTRSFPDYTMIAGIPARAIKRYDPAVKDWVRAD
jgi:acetyltransferase-like isoleucine patch superfamily enzyme